MDSRGKIINRARKQQIVDFSGLRYGNITPTDIDGMIEYKNKAFVFIEIKHRDAPCPYGQKLALQRMVESCQKSGKQGVAIICEHYVDDCQSDILADKCIVRELYYLNWRQPKQKGINLKDFVDTYINWVNK